MTDVRGLAVQLTALRVLADKVSERATAVKAELSSALDPGDRKTAALDDGTAVGSITYAKGRLSARVADERALAEWVLAHYPDEVVPQVRPAFLSAILAASKAAGVPMTPAGELDVPGVELVLGEPFLSVKPDPEAVSRLVDAIRANGLLALEAGP